MAKIKLKNYLDVAAAKARRIPKRQIRQVEAEALVDTGAMMLVVPQQIADALGCPVREHRRVTLADGRRRTVPLIDGLLIEVLGRQMSLEALVMPRGTIVLLGQIPLEGLDLVVRPRTRDVMPNPAHPDGPIMDIFAAAG